MGLEDAVRGKNQRKKKMLAERRGIGDGAGGRADGLHDKLLLGMEEQRKYHKRKLKSANFYLKQCMDLSLPVSRLMVKGVG